MDAEQTRKEVNEAILAGEMTRAVQLLDDHARSSGYPSAMREILEPVLVAIGESWNREQISLAQGYVAGKVAEILLGKMLQGRQTAEASPERKRHIVLGNTEEDFHALGRKLVSVFSEAAGWQVHDLGNDVSAEAFVDKAEQTGARVIGVSAMMLTTAENIARVRQEIERRRLGGRIQLAVGGAVFKLRPALVSEVGGDGTALSCIEAPRLFEALWRNSLEASP